MTRVQIEDATKVRTVSDPASRGMRRAPLRKLQQSNLVPRMEVVSSVLDRLIWTIIFSRNLSGH